MATTYRRANPTLRTWWDQPFEYGWAVQLLQDRGLLRYHRITLSLVAFINFIPAVIGLYWFLFTPGMGRAFGPWIAIPSTIVAISLSIYWLIGPWMTENVSRTVIFGADIATVVFVFAYNDWYLAMPGLALLASNGIYLLVHHDARTVMVHLTLSTAALIAVALGCRLVQDVSTALVVVRFSTLLPIITGVVLALLPLIVIMRSAASESLRDDLTGLDNRRGLTSKVDALISRSTPLTVLVVDIDHFKRVNDTYGHAVGDEVIIAVATAMRRCAPLSGSTIARTGGEEFAMVISDYADDGEHLADRLHDGIQSATDGVTVTVSIGVTTAPGIGRRFDVAALLNEADQAMYQAKRSGGNQTVLF